MAYVVKGDLYEQLDGKLFEIKRQIRQKGGYPYDPNKTLSALQAIIEGRFGDGSVLTINRSKPFDPAKFIGKGWTIEEQDERSLALTQVTLADITLQTTLKESDNGRVQGEEKLRRLKAESLIRLDAGIFQALWENKSLIPESWKIKNAVYFDGTVLRNPNGYRYVLYLYWDGDRWRWHCNWLDNDWGAGYPSAVLAK